MANNSDRFLRTEGRSTGLKSEVKMEVAKVSEFDSQAQYRSNDRDRSYDLAGRSSPRGSSKSSRRDKGGDVGYDRRGSSRKSGGSRDSSYERYGSRDSSRERYRGRESRREMRDKLSRYRDNSMDRFEREKYKERRETSRYDEGYRDNNNVELQNLTNKSDREHDIKKGHTGQDWWTCETKRVKSSGYAEIGSRGGRAQSTREVQVSMGYDGKHSHDEVSDGAKKVAEPVSVMEKVCSFLAEVSSNGILYRDGHERKVAEIEREEKEVRRKSKEKLARLKAIREAAVMELENVKAFRVVVQKLAEVQRRVAGSRPALVAGGLSSLPLIGESKVKTEGTESEVEESLLTQPPVSEPVESSGCSGGGSVVGDRGHGDSDRGHRGSDRGHGGSEGGGEDQESEESGAAKYDGSSGLLESDGTPDELMDQE
ncbi:pre-mRNA-splicing factor 38B-like [Watersipora subatra]|uniref:pre-mRNA-splicing factor 38B-like n=1 Tax=Watersipora subatra TaxID=2589382 RepID=UPI00355C6E0F